MKIKPYNRISFRFYLFVTLIIVASVSVTSWRFSNFFLLYLQHNFRTSTIDSAQITGLRIAAEIRDIERSINQFMHNERQVNAQTLASLFSNIQTANRAVLSYAVISVDQSQRENLLYSSADDQRLQEIVNKIQPGRIRPEAHRGTSLYAFENEIVLLRTYSIEQTKTWIHHIVLLDNNILAPYSGIDENRAVRILNHNFEDLRKIDFQFNLDEVFSLKDRRWKSILENDIGSGFLSNLRDDQNRQWVGAYYRDPLYGFMVVVLHNADSIQGSFSSVLSEVIDWVVLILLVSLAFVFLLTRPILANIELLFYATHEIARGNFHKVPDVRSRDEIGYLAAAIRWMARQISNLLASEKQKILYEKELQTANTVQKTFFKEENVHSEPFDLVAFYKPASECGGDWWGHFNIKPGVDLVLMGDATGHGVPAALITAIAFTTSNIMADSLRNGELDYKKPSTILDELNKILYGCLHGQFCMTFVAVVFDAYQGKIYYSNGGHPFPILMPSNDTDPRLARRGNNRPAAIHLGYGKGQQTSILGISNETKFFDNEYELKIGDRIVLYTDGITETRNRDGKQWGSRNFLRSLTGARSLGNREALDHVIKSLHKFSSNRKYFEDDLTLLVIEYSDVVIEGL